MASGSPQSGGGVRQVALHVNFNDPERLNYVLNNAENIYQHYRRKGIKIEIRIIAHGPGLHMFRDDTSPVRERVSKLAASQEGVSFHACSNTKERMEKAEGKTLVIMDEASMVSSGIGELIELQLQGWNYIKP